MKDLEFHQVEDDGQKALAGRLIEDYLDTLNTQVKREHGITFDIDAMLIDDLTNPIKLHPPSGRFYLVQFDTRAVGVGCLKKLSEGVGEIQRMFVPPSFRGRGVGRAIATRLIDDARSIGYRKIRLESLGFLKAAHRLYRSLGFEEIEPYAEIGMRLFQSEEQLRKYCAITVFMELNLE